jgi:curli biogenesis system outer membrane secretion channel CsgG
MNRGQKMEKIFNKYLLVLTAFILVLTAAPAAADSLDKAVDTVVSELTTDLFMEIPRDEDYKIAVADFLNQNNQKTQLSNFISENITITLINESGQNIKVLERQRLNSILKEQDRMISGVLKQETSEKIGELLGADSIIIGKYYNIKKEIYLIAKLVSIETGYIHSAVKLVLDKDEVISSMLGESYIQRTMN